MRKISEYYYLFLKKFTHKYEKSKSFAKKSFFVNRQKNSENLLIVLAGYQPFYWDVLFEKINENVISFSEEIDVCVCCPGGCSESVKLPQYCEKYNFSFLKIKEDLLARIQNQAILLHPKAKNIFKIDEDIILCKDYFSKMLRSYSLAEKKLNYKIGFLAPLINLNAFCSKYFLEAIGVEKEYEKLFGKYFVDFNWEKALIHYSPDVALFIWNNSIPFDQTANQISDYYKNEIKVCHHRFSIGAILFKREIWEKMDYFSVGLIGQLGLEESDFCKFCMDRMLSIVVACEVFCGHLGFGNQKEAVKNFYFDNLDKIQ